MTEYDGLFLLNGLSLTEKKEIAALFPDPTHFQAGALICSPESNFNALAFLVSGTAVAVIDNKRQMVMKKFAPGSCFGASALFGGDKSYVSTVLADSAADVLFIDEPTLTAIFAKYPATAVNYISFLSEKVRFLNTKLSVISCPSAEDSVFKYLESSADRDGYARLPGSMTLFSNMLGIGRASLYRSLDTLEESGAIKWENNKIKVIKNEKDY